MQRGYVKIWRKLEDSGLFQNPEVCQLFLYLMLKVTYKPRKILVGTSIIDLQPGQLFTGRKKLALEMNSTEQKVRTSLATLKKMKIINQHPSKMGSVISFINWRHYQHENTPTIPLLDPTQPPYQPTANHLPTNEQPIPNQKPTTKQEDKNIKNQKTKHTSGECCMCDDSQKVLSTAGDDEARPEYEDGMVQQNVLSLQTQTTPKTDCKSKGTPDWVSFLSCYNVYPVQQGQEDAWREWMRLKNNRVLEPAWVIRDAILNLSAHDSRWLEGMVPRMAKWLTSKGWNDEPYIKPNTGKKQSNRIPLPRKTPEQIAKERVESEKMLAAMRQRSRIENKKLLENLGVSS